MSGKFDEYGRSLGFAAASLTTAVVGMTLAALASMNPVTCATVVPILATLTFEVSKDLMKDAYKHLEEGLKIQEPKTGSTHSENYLR